MYLKCAFFLKMMDDKRVRVSCSGLTYSVIDGDLLGVVSKSRLRKGKFFVTPIGGKHKFGEGTNRLLGAWDAQLEKPEKSELAFYMPPENLDDFSEWYFSRDGREVVPLREVAEELIDEEGVFPDGNRRYLFSEGFVLAKQTARVGLDDGPVTHYFFDVYRLDIPGLASRVRDTLGGNGIRLVSRDEAAAEMLLRPGSDEHKGKVGDMFKFFGLSGEELESLVAAQPAENKFRVYRQPESQVYEGASLR